MSERLDVKGILVGPDRESKKYPFDPARDINEEHRRGMEEARAQWLKEGNILVFSRMSAFEYMLGVPVEVTKTQHQSMERYWQAESNGVSDSATVYWYEKILGLPTAPVSGLKEKVMNRQEGYLSSGVAEYFLTYSFLLKVLDEPVTLSVEEIALIKGITEKQYGKGEMVKFACCAAYERVLGISSLSPERMQELTHAREVFARPSSWYPFCLMAMYQAILSADKVIIPAGGGLELVYDRSDDFTSQASSLPETRNF